MKGVSVVFGTRLEAIKMASALLVLVESTIFETKLVTAGQHYLVFFIALPVGLSNSLVRQGQQRSSSLNVLWVAG